MSFRKFAAALSFLSLIATATPVLFGCSSSQKMAASNGELKFPPYKISKDEYDQLRESLLLKLDNSVAHYAKVTIIGVEGESSIYYFTNTDHPAYPCYVKRTFSLNEKGIFRLDTSGSYAGDEKLCKDFFGTMRMVGEMEIQNLWRRMFVPVG